MLWSEVELTQEMWSTFVEPMEDPTLVPNWVDQEHLSIDTQEHDGNQVAVRSYFRVCGCSADKVWECMYEEEGRKKIDSTIVSYQSIERVDDATDVVHHHSGFPLKLMQDRDAVMWRRRLVAEPGVRYAVIWTTCEHPARPETEGVIRIHSGGAYRIDQVGPDVDVRSVVRTEVGGAIPLGVVKIALLPSLLTIRKKIEKYSATGDE